MGVLSGLTDFIAYLYEFYSTMLPYDLSTIIDSLIGLMLLLAVWRVVT